MKKILFQPCLWALVALSALATSCKETEGGTVAQRPTVNIELNEVSLTGVTATFTPSEGASKFDFALGLPSDEADFLAGNFLGTQTVLSNDPNFSAKTQSWTSDIEPDTYYVVYARAYDAAGNPGPLSARGFNSANDDFKVEIQYVSDVTAGFHVTCTNDYYKYAYAFGLAANKENDLLDFNDDVMAGMMTVSDVYDNYINSFRLADGSAYALEPETEYVFYCKGFDRSNGTTDVIAINFTTAASDAVPNYTIEPGEMDFLQQHYTVTPNSLTSRVALWQNAYGTDYETTMFGPYNWKGDLLSMLSSWADDYTPETVNAMSRDFLTFSAVGETLEAAPYTYDMELEQTVEVYVLCYNDMFEPVNVRKQTFTTPALNESLPTSKASDFSVEMTKLTAGDLAFTVAYTGDAVRAYYYELYDGAGYDALVAADGEEAAKLTVRSKILASAGFIYNEPSATLTYTGTDVVAGKKYYVAIAPMNANGPREYGWGEVAMFPFTAE